MSALDAFFIDHDYDRDYATNRTSRYGAYLALHADMFSDDGAPTTRTDDPVYFALTAWDIANSPIMAPGYVRTAPRVVNTSGEWDDEHRAALVVTLAIPLLPVVTGALRTLWRTWEHDTVNGRVYAPYDNTRLTVLTTMSISIPIRSDMLPVPQYWDDVPDTTVAREAVISLCALLNEHINSVLSAMD